MGAIKNGLKEGDVINIHPLIVRKVKTSIVVSCVLYPRYSELYKSWFALNAQYNIASLT